MRIAVWLLYGAGGGGRVDKALAEAGPLAGLPSLTDALVASPEYRALIVSRSASCRLLVMKWHAGPLHLFQNVSGFCGPDKWFGVVIVMVDIFSDGLHQILYAAENTATQSILNQVAEEAFHNVEPRAASGCEVNVEARMASEPAIHLRMLVGGVVIHDHMNLFTSPDHVIDGAEELQPFLMAVPILTQGHHLAFQRVESGKQRGRAIALVVVGHGAAAPFLHGQAGLGAVQNLNLTLLVAHKTMALGVVTDNAPPERILALTHTYSVHYQILIRNHATAQAYGGLPELPTSFFIDRYGKIVAEMEGADSKEQIETNIRRALE